MSIEPKMEDLLASIRKAIDNDVGGQGSSVSGETRGTLMRGALREMRVSMAEEKPKRTRQAAEEIAELRGRILRNAAEVPPIPPPPRRPSRPMIEPPRPQAPPTRGEFRGILAGQPAQRAVPETRSLPAPYPPEPPPQIRSKTLQEEFDDITYNENRGSSSYHDPYAGQPTYTETTPAYEETYDYEPQAPPPQNPRMLSSYAEAATQAAFRHLSETMFARGIGDRSFEEVTRELLRGMLKQWLDDNLPALVERIVREEIARVARNGR